jgi:NarL family two-component system response regulator LiaR
MLFGYLELSIMSVGLEPIRVLVTEGNPILLQGIVSLIREQKDMELVGTATSVDDAAILFQAIRPSVAIVDLDPSHSDALRLVRDLFRIDANACVIVLTGYELDPAGLEAIASGAAAIVAKHQADSSLPATIREVVRRNP